MAQGEAKKRISGCLRVAHRASLAGNCSLDHYSCIISHCTLDKVVHISLTSMAFVVASAFDISGVAAMIFSPFAQAREGCHPSRLTAGILFRIYLQAWPERYCQSFIPSSSEGRMLRTATEGYTSHYWLLPSDDVASEKADKYSHSNIGFRAVLYHFWQSTLISSYHAT